MNAQQAAHLGAGVAIPQKFPIRSKVVGPQLAAGLQRVLHEPRIRAAAHRISALMQAERWTPAEQAASIIEGVGWTAGSLCAPLACPALLAWRDECAEMAPACS